MVFKTLALLVSLGSGTSGGLLAPMFMTSAAMGRRLCHGVELSYSGGASASRRVCPGGHGAVFGAAANATFAFIIFAFEITRDYNSVLPLMLVSVIASGIARRFMKHSIMTEKLARRGLHVHQDYEADVFQQVTVQEVMSKEPPTVLATMKLTELADRIVRNESQSHQRQAALVLDTAGRLVGIITRGDVLRLLQQNPDDGVTVGEVCTATLVVAYPDESVHDALVKLLTNALAGCPLSVAKRRIRWLATSVAPRRWPRAPAATKKNTCANPVG